MGRQSLKRKNIRYKTLVTHDLKVRKEVNQFGRHTGSEGLNDHPRMKTLDKVTRGGPIQATI